MCNVQKQLHVWYSLPQQWKIFGSKEKIPQLKYFIVQAQWHILKILFDFDFFFHLVKDLNAIIPYFSKKQAL